MASVVCIHRVTNGFEHRAVRQFDNWAVVTKRHNGETSTGRDFKRVSHGADEAAALTDLNSRK